MKMSNQTYDFLKWITTIVLPASGTLYFTLSRIWGLPHCEQIVGTITAVVTFLGVVLGISNANYKKTNDDNVEIIENEPEDFEYDCDEEGDYDE